MKIRILFFAVVALGGCTKAGDDKRLQGTWRSNREATVAAAFQRDPRWNHAKPEKIDRFKEIFGDLEITYSNGIETIRYRGHVGSYHYRVVKRGADYDAVHSDLPLNFEQDKQIHFVDNARSYWIDCGPVIPGLQERFDKISD